MSYEWYPGHMTKAVRMMKENLPLTDLVIELTDARIPRASRNPDIDAMCAGKARLMVMTKTDLSDRTLLREWEEFYRKLGIVVFSADIREPSARKKLMAAIDEATAEKRARNERRGIRNQPINALVAGIPNVGKSTMINLLAGKSAAKTGNKPGVTRGKQWIQAGKGLQLLDTPGILWPRIGDRDTGELLAITGSMNDNNLDETELAVSLIRRLDSSYPDVISERYGLDKNERSDMSDAAACGILEKIALKRGFLGQGGEPVTERAASALINDFRGGRLGGILLERTGGQNG